MTTDLERSDLYFRKEQDARKKINERMALLFERARRQIDVRIWHYPKGMRAQYQRIVEDLHRDMCDEDLECGRLIGLQQFYLRQAQAYRIRALRGVSND